MVFRFCPTLLSALGLLSGKIDPEREFTGDDLRKNNPRFSVSNRRKVSAFMEEIRPIASAHKATASQIVIAWTLQQPGITFALCGARNPGKRLKMLRPAGSSSHPPTLRQSPLPHPSISLRWMPDVTGHQ